MLSNPIGRVRVAGFIEGVSALVLFFVAMPLKYVGALQDLSGQPELGKSAVFWVGSIHGGLFVLYAAVAFWAYFAGHLSQKLLGYAALASIIPFGPFVIDRKLKDAETAPPAA